MSGGSYDYLFLKEPGEISRHEDTVQRMAERLSGLGYAQDAARETESVLLLARQFEARMRARLERLSEVWRAVEWWDSGDSGEDYLEQALLQYRSDLRLVTDMGATAEALANRYRLYRVGQDAPLTGPISYDEAIAMLEEAAGGPVKQS